MSKTIFDIIRFYLENVKVDVRSFDVDIFRINFFSHLEIRLLSGKWWFVFPCKTENNTVFVDKPNGIHYDTIILDSDIFQDLFTMDDNQLILTYGKFYPDYLSGDLSVLYDGIVKEITS